jgi:AcrR family transcriptional regulator
MATGAEPTATGEVKTRFAYPRVMGAEATTVRATSARRISPAREEKYRAEKQQIVRAAYELIKRDGSKETSVHDVLRAAGLSTRAFYRHFRSKDELVLEMYQVDCDRVNATVAAAVAAAAEPLAALEAWIDQNLAVVYEPRRLRHAVVLSSTEVSSAEGYTDVKNAGLAEQRASLVALLHDGRAQGVFPHAQPETDSLAIQAVVGAHMRARLDRDPAALTRADARDRTVDLFRRALGVPE